MHGGDRGGELAGERVVEFAALGEMVEGLVLVEALHFDRPFDRFAGPVESQRTVGLPRDRDNAAVKLRREFAIDVEFGAAGRFPFVERRVIEEGITHRALDLDGAFAGQEYHRGVGLAAPDVGPAIGRRIAKKLKNGSL